MSHTYLVSDSFIHSFKSPLPPDTRGQFTSQTCFLECGKQMENMQTTGHKGPRPRVEPTAVLLCSTNHCASCGDMWEKKKKISGKLGSSCTFVSFIIFNIMSEKTKAKKNPSCGWRFEKMRRGCKSKWREIRINNNCYIHSLDQPQCRQINGNLAQVMSGWIIKGPSDWLAGPSGVIGGEMMKK